MLFFFYGTLIAGNSNPAACRVHARLVPRGAAVARGRLYAIADPAGWYPALVAGDGAVCGQLYAAGPGFSTDDLTALDAFETCFPDLPELSDYLREVRPVTDAGGTVHEAQVYLWNRPVPPGAPLVGDGDFARWLAAQGLPAFRG